LGIGLYNVASKPAAEADATTLAMWRGQGCEDLVIS
jgi:hypothetical protein